MPDKSEKTFIVREFAKEHYENFIELNFFKFEAHKKVFAGSLDPETIYKQITLLPGARLNPGKTLIFLDEIQDCGQARTALKFLAEDDKFDEALALAFAFSKLIEPTITQIVATIIKAVIYSPFHLFKFML